MLDLIVIDDSAWRDISSSKRTYLVDACQSRRSADALPGAYESLDEILSGRLRQIARVVLGDASAVIGDRKVSSPKGGPSSVDVGGSVFVFGGMARVGDADRPWSVVLKVLGRTANSDDPLGIGYWQREAALYRSGVLDSLSGGLRAPRCYAVDEVRDGLIWLWIERAVADGERAWPLDRWALAARHLGEFNGSFPVGTGGQAPGLPRAPWLGGRRLRSWLDRHEPLVARIATAPDDPAVRHWWPRTTVDAILRLWDQRDAFCDALERLPLALGHGDAIRRNLFGRRGPGGGEETIAIDWEFAGFYALGEEVGQTLSVASAFYDLEPGELPALDEALFHSYLAGLRDAGWRGDEMLVRFAYAACAALRNVFNAVGATVPDDAHRAAGQKTFGRSWEELAERRAEIRPFLLARADEARRLLRAR